MIKVYKPVHDGCKIISEDDTHECSDGPDGSIGLYCTTCYRRWPCQYEGAKQYKARVYAKIARAIASGATPDQVASAAIHAVESDNIGYHYDGGDPEGMNLRYRPIIVKGI